MSARFASTDRHPLLCLVKIPSDLYEARLHCSRTPNGASVMDLAATEMRKNGTATSQTTVTIGQRASEKRLGSASGSQFGEPESTAKGFFRGTKTQCRLLNRICQHSQQLARTRDLTVRRVSPEVLVFDRSYRYKTVGMKHLLRRRRELLQALPPLEEVVRGSVFTRRLRCGKPGCHCARGNGHRATYLSVTFPGGRTEQISLPAALVPVARRWVANYLRWWRVLEKVSALNRKSLSQQRLAATAPGKKRKKKP